MNKLMRWSCVFAGVLLSSVAAQAESNWPTRLIKATIPFGPGSADRRGAANIL